jgi:hypothetical protein
MSIRPAHLTVALVPLACAAGRQCDMRFDRLRAADRVVISSNLNKPLRTIADTQLIAQLVGFALDHQADWRAPWYGTPVPSFRAQFYRGSTFLGDLGIGGDFLEAQGCDGFQSRSVSAPDRARIVALFGVPDPHRTDAN